MRIMHFLNIRDNPIGKRNVIQYGAVFVAFPASYMDFVYVHGRRKTVARFTRFKPRRVRPLEIAYIVKFTRSTG